MTYNVFGGTLNLAQSISHRDITTLCSGDPRLVFVKALAAESCQN